MATTPHSNGWLVRTDRSTVLMVGDVVRIGWGRTGMQVALLCALTSQMLCVQTAAAQTAPDSQPAAETGVPKQQAVGHYDRGKALYLEGRYREALVELKAALDLDPQSPELMYNVARVSELLGNLDEAIVHYRRYWAAIPTSDQAEREKINAAIKRIEGARSEIEPNAAETDGGLKSLPPESETEAPAAKRYGNTDTWFWATGVAGIAALTLGAVTGVLALERENKVNEFVAGGSADGTLSERESLVDQANTLSVATDVLLVGGVALTAGAALLYFLRAPAAETDGDVAQPTLPRFAVGPRAAFVSLSGSF